MHHFIHLFITRNYVSIDWAKFEANDKDLESDDALWDLYERRCKFFNQERDREEMARRFSYFKETAESGGKQEI